MRFKFLKIATFLLSVMIVFSLAGCNNEEDKIIVNNKAYHYSTYACFLNNSFNERKRISTYDGLIKIQVISNNILNDITLTDYKTSGNHKLECSIESFNISNMIGKQNGYYVYDVCLDIELISNPQFNNETVKITSLSLDFETDKGKTSITTQTDNISVSVYYVAENVLTFYNYRSGMSIIKDPDLFTLPDKEIAPKDMRYLFNVMAPFTLKSSTNIVIKSIDFSGENVSVDTSYTPEYANMNKLLTTVDEITRFTGVVKLEKEEFDHLGDYVVVKYSLLGETEIIEEPICNAELSLINSSGYIPFLTFNQYI